MSDKKGAIAFLNSMRGQLIISQALVIAIEELEKVPDNRREHSNIQDMQFLLDELFPIYAMVRATQTPEVLMQMAKMREFNLKRGGKK